MQKEKMLALIIAEPGHRITHYRAKLVLAPKDAYALVEALLRDGVIDRDVNDYLRPRGNAVRSAECDTVSTLIADVPSLTQTDDTETIREKIIELLRERGELDTNQIAEYFDRNVGGIGSILAKMRRQDIVASNEGYPKKWSLPQPSTKTIGDIAERHAPEAMCLDLTLVGEILVLERKLNPQRHMRPHWPKLLRDLHAVVGGSIGTELESIAHYLEKL